MTRTSRSTPQGLSESAAIPGVGDILAALARRDVVGRSRLLVQLSAQEQPWPRLPGRHLVYRARSAKASAPKAAASSAKQQPTECSSVDLITTSCCTRRTSSDGRFAGLQTQIHWNWNLTTDVRRLAWANTTEQGPGMRFRIPGAPKSVLFSASALQGDLHRHEGQSSA